MENILSEKELLAEGRALLDVKLSRDIPKINYDRGTFDKEAMEALKKMFPDEEVADEHFNHNFTVAFGKGLYGYAGVTNGDLECQVFLNQETMANGESDIGSVIVARVSYSEEKKRMVEAKVKLTDLKVGDAFHDSELEMGVDKKESGFADLEVAVIGDHVYTVTNMWNRIIVARDVGNGHGVVMSVTDYSNEEIEEEDLEAERNCDGCDKSISYNDWKNNQGLCDVCLEVIS